MPCITLVKNLNSFPTVSYDCMTIHSSPTSKNNQIEREITEEMSDIQSAVGVHVFMHEKLASDNCISRIITTWTYTHTNNLRFEQLSYTRLSSNINMDIMKDIISGGSGSYDVDNEDIQKQQQLAATCLYPNVGAKLKLFTDLTEPDSFSPTLYFTLRESLNMLKNKYIFKNPITNT